MYKKSSDSTTSHSMDIRSPLREPVNLTTRMMMAKILPYAHSIFKEDANMADCATLSTHQNADSMQKEGATGGMLASLHTLRSNNTKIHMELVAKTETGEEGRETMVKKTKHHEGREVEEPVKSTSEMQSRRRSETLTQSKTLSKKPSESYCLITTTGLAMVTWMGTLVAGTSNQKSVKVLSIWRTV